MNAKHEPLNFGQLGQGSQLPSTINSLATLSRLTTILTKILQGPSSKDIAWLFADADRAAIAKSVLGPSTYSLYRPASQQEVKKTQPPEEITHLELEPPTEEELAGVRAFYEALFSGSSDDIGFRRKRTKSNNAPILSCIPKYAIGVLMKKGNSDLSDDEVLWLLNNPKHKSKILEARKPQELAELKLRYADLKRKRRIANQNDGLPDEAPEHI